MKQGIALFACLLAVIALLGCEPEDDLQGPDDGGLDTGEVTITVLYTNDEHGWMEATDTYGGAAGMMGLWRDVEGYEEDGPFLVLSGGDNWTGSAISTWTNGASMVEVMNAMGYDASAFGNHEVDFGLDTMQQRMAEADFPYLAANMKDKTTGQVPGFAAPYTLIEVEGVTVGVIGLANEYTAESIFPEYAENYEFTSYTTALDEYVPEMKAAGAEILLLIGHICSSEMYSLVQAASGHEIAMIGGGHCRDTVSEMLDGVALVHAGYYMLYYAKVELVYDRDAGEITGIETSLHDNIGGTPDAAVETIVNYWASVTEAELGSVIGYVQEQIVVNSAPMTNMITDSWLISVPTGDVSMINHGGMRQSIPAGDITVGTIVGVLPFENFITEVEMSGLELIDYHVQSGQYIGGMTSLGGYALLDGTPIEDASSYNLLVSDYMYYSTGLDVSHPDAYFTGINWRDPVIDWIESCNTSASDPLDNYLDYTPRQ